MPNFPNLDFRPRMEKPGMMGPPPESNLGQPETTPSPYEGSDDPYERQQELWSSVSQQNKIAQASETIPSEAQTSAATPTDSSTSSESSTTESLTSSTTTSSTSSSSSTSSTSSSSRTDSTSSTSGTSSESSSVTSSVSSTTSSSVASITPYESSTLAIPTATSDATSANSDSSSGISPTNKKIAIAVPVTVVGLLIVIALLWFFLRRRRRRRDELPSYDGTTNQTPAVSTAKLMATPVVAAPDHAASTLPRLPLLDAPETSSSDDRSPVGSADQMSVRSGFGGSQPELGLAVAVPLHHRHSATEQAMHRVSRTASVAGTMTPHLRLPREIPHDDDAVSVESNERRPEHDLEDMSSVSSFEDDDDRNVHSRTDDRGHWPLRSP